MEEAEKEMGGKTWSLSELEALLSEDGVLEASDNHCQKIASDEHTRFLLVRDITKAMSEAKTQAGPSTSKVSASQLSPPPQIDEDEEDLDLQRAIQLSLGNQPEEIETNADERIKLNPQQRQKFSSTIQTHGLIRGFMMEYAQMNDTDIKNLVESTQPPIDNEDFKDSFREKFPNTDEYVLYGTPKKNQPQITIKEKFEATAEIPIEKVTAISGSGNDVDLVDVHPASNLQSAKGFVITVEADLNTFSKEEDLFADVFGSSSQNVECIPDVEVASISSDNDTMPYDIAQEDFIDINESEKLKTCCEEEDVGMSENEIFWSGVEADAETIIESGFVSEEGKSTEPTDSTTIASDKAKFRSKGEASDDKIDVEIVKATGNDIKESNKDNNEIPELSENEKFWADAGEVIETPDESESKITKQTIREKSPPPAKVASPFFVNRKTPDSKKKETSKAIVRNRAVAKTLFPEPQIAIQLAANELKNQNSSDELHQMRNQLIDEQKNLLQERNKMDRMGTSITESMSRDCKDLLKLFGIPYIDSPMEAEAQCAFLNSVSLTDGSISDDSDIWLFGGQTVYKNFFVQKKIVMEFSNENINQMFHLDRKKLIQLAMLVGSDYTVGINGVGAVTALEILAAFPPTEVESCTDEYQSLVSSLRKFRDWFQNGKQPGPGGKTILKSKLRNVELFEGFPNINVARAYLEPIVDTDSEPFTWGMPDSESLVEFAKAKLGWTRLKTEEILSPVIKRLNEKKQSTIKDYFKSQISKKFFDNKKLSKRVQKAVGKMGGEDEPEVEKIPKKTNKRKASSKAKAVAENLDDLIFVSSGDELDVIEEKKSKEDKAPEASTSAICNKLATKVKPGAKLHKKTIDEPKTTQRKRKSNDSEPGLSTSSNPGDFKKTPPRIPNVNQVIPQREKDKEDQDKAKQKAIELFKKTNNKNQRK